VYYTVETESNLICESALHRAKLLRELTD
jgi:hypothetical protein